MALRMIEMVLPEDVGHYAHDYLRDQGDLAVPGLSYLSLRKNKENKRSFACKIQRSQILLWFLLAKGGNEP